ncbi:MAG: hypothetical protein IH989_05135 [Planctomycetes bacterium]|nr:hypothetical protein [Planctomycetota bacterium]
MAISPIQVTRISHNLRASFVTESLRRTQRELFAAQARIASGRAFVSASENPIAAGRVLDLRSAHARQDQFVANLRQGANFLGASESAMLEINELLIEAGAVASQNVSNLTSAEEREAESVVIAAIREQIVAVGNRSLLGRFIFGGRMTTDQPFRSALGGVAYVGDTSELVTRVDDGLLSSISTPGNLVFGALSESVSNGVDLSPLLTETTRLDDIHGIDRTRLESGTLVLNEVGGTGTIHVDLSDAETLGDVVTLINEASSSGTAGYSAALGAAGLEITPGALPLSITDTVGGAIAASLGIFVKRATSEPITGQALLARLTRLTPVAELAGGSGIDLDGGLIINNGGKSFFVDFSDAQTVQDIINTINRAGASVRARINDAHTGIDLFNQVSGTSLTIGENGGTTAADLGIRTFDETTALAKLNSGLGVSIEEGKDDLRITARDGSIVDVNLDGAVTIGDVITLINTAATDAGVSVTALLATTGNGLRISDETAGDGDPIVSILNLSSAADDLGLTGVGVDEDGKLVGRDVNPNRTNGIIDALYELERALIADDTRAITISADRLAGLADNVIRSEGIIGARSRSVQAKLAQMQDAAFATELFLADIEGLDFVEAATQMQSALTQIQANLQTSSALLNLSILDFLR